MNVPFFHPIEVALIGPQATDPRVRGELCIIRGVLKPIDGVYRYNVYASNGILSTVLEPTLRKAYSTCEWDVLKDIWQPTRKVP